MHLRQEMVLKLSVGLNFINPTVSENIKENIIAHDVINLT